MNPLPETRPESACSCNTCKAMCRSSPCFPTPQEAITLIEKGYQDKMQLSIYIDPVTTRPYAAITGAFTDEGCAFQSKTTGLCELHEPGLKPLEGRLANHRYADAGLRLHVARSWHTEQGLAVIKHFPDPSPDLKTFAQEIIIYNQFLEKL